ncbi:MAG: type IVB secretion system apparatus protein IcmL/DotI [Alphaproteobacteria bacterium]|nr:type IVB secretion system apparatus protein IcmL/DotI [Alphaproteobacteria bacterium]MCB9985585.1 type IVB secretion system apparatus protein IcmL/DotI [Micavibrio sp.]
MVITDPQNSSALSDSASASQQGVVKKKSLKIPTMSPAAMGRSAYYRAGYRRILRIAVFESMVIVSLVALLFFIVDVHRPENRYFATTEDGDMIEMTPLYVPNLSVKALTSWSAQAATEVMTFGFNDYRRRLQEASRNFTPTGWQSFIKALNESRIIETVEANQQLILSAPAGVPVLVSEGLVKGRYEWQVQVPLVITYQAQSKVSSERLLITLTLVAVHDVESSSGVGIERWVAQ